MSRLVRASTKEYFPATCSAVGGCSSDILPELPARDAGCSAGTENIFCEQPKPPSATSGGTVLQVCRLWQPLDARPSLPSVPIISDVLTCRQQETSPSLTKLYTIYQSSSTSGFPRSVKPCRRWRRILLCVWHERWNTHQKRAGIVLRLYCTFMQPKAGQGDLKYWQKFHAMPLPAHMTETVFSVPYACLYVVVRLWTLRSYFLIFYESIKMHLLNCACLVRASPFQDPIRCSKGYVAMNAPETCAKCKSLSAPWKSSCSCS